MNIQDFGMAPKDNPLCYPGKRPPHSFLFCSDDILSITMTPNVKIEDCMVDDITLAEKLEEYGAKGISDRYLVVGYGSNANPAQLQNKFKNNVNSIFPVFKGTITGYDVSYARAFASYGAIPATITDSPGTVVEVWANLFDEEQLEIMNKTEGRGTSYCLGRLNSALTLENNEIFSSACSYIHMQGSLPVNSKPIRLDMISAINAKFDGLDQPQILSKISEMFGLSTTPEEFLSEIKCKRRNYTKKLCNLTKGIPTMGFTEIPRDGNPPNITATKRSF